VCLAVPGARVGSSKRYWVKVANVTYTVRTLVAGRVLNRLLLAPKHSLLSTVLFGKDLGAALSKCHEHTRLFCGEQ
jgi:hypothetical protein